MQEAILKGNGFLQHKELKEGVIDEVADVFNVCLALLVSHYPDATVEELIVRLDNAMKTKNAKYAEILGVKK